jgi:hypothetical protein
MVDVSSWTVAVKKTGRHIREVSQLVKDPTRNVNDLSGAKHLKFIPKCHFSFAFKDHIDLFIGMVVPRHLAAIWFERNLAHAEA